MSETLSRSSPRHRARQSSTLKSMQVVVIGAGVSGLSSALRLVEAGHAVQVWARERPLETTSAVAAAIWYPYLAEPADRVREWAGVTLREFVRLAADPATGIVLRDGLELFRDPVDDPPWASGRARVSPRGSGRTAARIRRRLRHAPSRSSTCPSISDGWNDGCSPPAPASLERTVRLARGDRR